jgi:REase_DpnII-MboI
MSEDLGAIADEVTALLAKFHDSNILGRFLPTECEARFKRLSIEAVSQIDHALGSPNTFSTNLVQSIHSGSDGFLNGPSYAAVSEVAEIIRGAARHIARKERDPVAPVPEVALVKQVCRRLPHAARILGSRSRANKAPFTIEDKYDVQDLLHATLRAYLKYSVQEDPLPKVAGAKAGRADISIEEVGVLIEVKFVHGPQDQKRIFEEHSQDLVLYSQ